MTGESKHRRVVPALSSHSRDFARSTMVSQLADTLSGTDRLAACCTPVARYFFDTRDNEDFIEDDMGLEFPDLETVKAQAALSLAELARDVLPGSVKRLLAVEVRDEKQPILIATMTFEAIFLLK